MILPRMFGSPPKRRIQRAWLSSVTCVAAGQVLVRVERAAALDRRAEELEVVGRHLVGVQLLGHAAAGEVHDVGAVGRDVLDDAGLVAPELELRGRAGAEGALRRGLLEHDQPIRFGKRHRLEQHRVDDREDRGVGADPQGQRSHCGEGEPRAVPEGPEGVLHVVEEVCHRRHTCGARTKSFLVVTVR